MDWEQRTTEKLEHYTWFLAYRNLGPTRTLDRAYQALKGSDKAAPGAWRDVSHRHGWVARAQAWDVYNLTEAGARVVALFVEAMDALAQTAIAGLRANPPATFAEAARALELLASLVPAETVAEAQRTAAEHGVPAIGGERGGVFPVAGDISP